MTQYAAPTGPTMRLRLSRSAECTLITYSCLWFSLIRLLHELLLLLLLFVILQCLINVPLLLVLKPGVISAAADLP